MYSKETCAQARKPTVIDNWYRLAHQGQGMNGPCKMDTIVKARQGKAHLIGLSVFGRPYGEARLAKTNVKGTQQGKDTSKESKKQGRRFQESTSSKMHAIQRDRNSTTPLGNTSACGGPSVYIYNLWQEQAKFVKLSVGFTKETENFSSQVEHWSTKLRGISGIIATTLRLMRQDDSEL